MEIKTILGFELDVSSRLFTVLFQGDGAYTILEHAQKNGIWTDMVQVHLGYDSGPCTAEQAEDHVVWFLMSAEAQRLLTSHEADIADGGNGLFDD
jgi:hypothetical protein